MGNVTSRRRRRKIKEGAKMAQKKLDKARPRTSDTKKAPTKIIKLQQQTSEEMGGGRLRLQRGKRRETESSSGSSDSKRAVKESSSDESQKAVEKTQILSEKEEETEKSTSVSSSQQGSNKSFRNRREAQNQHLDMAAAVQDWVDRMLTKGIIGLQAEFFRLRSVTQPDPIQYVEFTKNMKFDRNRYKDVVCLDDSRVILRDHPSGVNYIHANFVGTPNSAKKFICSQAPTTGTVFDFWWMILQEGIEIIIMLGDFVEKGVKKCAEYIPLEENDDFTAQDIEIKCYSKEVLPGFGCKMICRSLAVNRLSTTAYVTHYNWVDWPDHGVPPADRTPLRLLQMVRSTQCPISVHCSAGIGRTGCIVTIEYILERIQNRQSCEDVVDIVKRLRTQRAGIIQTEHQYLYVHRIALLYFMDLKLITPTNPSLDVFLRDYNEAISRTKKKDLKKSL